MSVEVLRHSSPISFAICLVALGATSALVGCGSDAQSNSGNAAGSAGKAPATGTGGAPNAPTAGSGGTGVAPIAGSSSTSSAGAGGSAPNNTAGAPGAGGTSNTAGTSSTNTAGSGGSNGGSGNTAGSANGGSSNGGGPSATCPATVLAAGNTDKTLKIGSATRNYVLHVPSGYDGKKAVPLVIDFHGLGGSGPNERTSSPYPAQTDPDGVIMAFPTGLSGPSGSAWNVGPCCVKDTDDVAFAKALVNEVKTLACIDPKRVYAVGFSMGGGMSHYLACHASDVFAAVAPAAFDLLKENVDDCKPTRPISVISFRGTSDPIVSYAGGASSVVSGMPITFLGAKATFAKWAEINQCTGSASAEDAQGCASYSSCKDGVEVMLCTKQGGSHEAGNAKVAWPILKKHTLP
jgi:polyhydroxybutyrate depolymerase